MNQCSQQSAASHDNSVSLRENNYSIVTRMLNSGPRQNKLALYSSSNCAHLDRRLKHTIMAYLPERRFRRTLAPPPPTPGPQMLYLMTPTLRLSRFVSDYLNSLSRTGFLWTTYIISQLILIHSYFLMVFLVTEWLLLRFQGKRRRACVRLL